MKEYAIKVKNLGKSFGMKGYQLKQICFSVEKHQFATILGPSGCGKTVLMNLLCGIEQPTEGEIEYNGTTFIKGVPANFRKNLGFAFQDNNLMAWRTVEENLWFPMEIFNLKKEMNIKERADQVLELVGLQNFKKSYPNELSGGMKQRVGFARALMHDPGILLLDQPFGALDAITRKMLNYDLLNIWKQTRKTIVMVTNNVEEALLLSSKAIFMKKNPGVIDREIEIPIPEEQRGIGVADWEGYEDLKAVMDAQVRALDIKVSGKEIVI